MFEVRMRSVWSMIFLIILLGWPCLSQASSPIDDLKAPIEHVLEILRDPQYKNPDMKQQQRDKIIQITDQVFDFKTMSRLALGRNWKSLNPQEQKDFVAAFGDLLNSTYMDKVQGEYRDETVSFLGQEIIATGKAIVKTKIMRKPHDIPVVYAMFLDGGKWRIYDVNIEGISLIKNYRTQFDQILTKDSPDQLIERIKKKSDLKTDIKTE